MKKVKTEKIALIIAAYNESDRIGSVLQEISHITRDHFVVVVDDGSHDNTVKIARMQPNVEVISHPTNHGQWAALRTGFIV